jgi:transposase
MGKKRRPSFTSEFKAEAVKLALDSKKPNSQVARDIGVSESALRRWIGQAEIDAGNNPTGALTSAERQELTRLRQELRQVKMERDFLKKTAKFFARES